MTNTHYFARDNIEFLKQGLELLSSINDEQYVTTAPPAFVSSVGAHMRHILDHYKQFLVGRNEGQVDYDKRKRDARLETDRAYTCSHIRQLMSEMAEITPS